MYNYPKKIIQFYSLQQISSKILQFHFSLFITSLILKKKAFVKILPDEKYLYVK